jgi:hypothetical protein
MSRHAMLSSCDEVRETSDTTGRQLLKGKHGEDLLYDECDLVLASKAGNSTHHNFQLNYDIQSKNKLQTIPVLSRRESFLCV